MEVERASVGEVQVFRVTGRLDSSTSPIFEAEVMKDIRAGANRVVFDFTAVPYVSSAGLRTVLMAAKQTRASKGAFAIAGMAQTVRHVFEMSGFAKIIAQYPTEDEAVAAVLAG